MLAPMSKRSRRSKKTKRSKSARPLARRQLVEGVGRGVNAPQGAFGRRFDAWIRARGFERMEDVAAAVGYSYDAVVKLRRGDRDPAPRTRADLEAFISGKKKLLARARNGR